MRVAWKMKSGMCLALCCLAATASSQQPINQGQPKQPRADREIRQTAATGEVGQGQDLNRVFAACLLAANKAEVELGQLAASRAESKEVKDFAQQMVKDHGEAVKKLEAIVGSQQPNDRRSQIEKQISDRCHQMVREELESKSGKEFDQCYIGSQIGGHVHMAAALDVLANETSGELQKIVKDAKPTVEKHLKHAKDLAKSSETHQARAGQAEQNR